MFISSRIIVGTRIFISSVIEFLDLLRIALSIVFVDKKN